MPHNNKDVFNVIFEWISANSPILYTFLLTILIAFFRLAYDGTKGWQRFTEAILCGFIALAVSAGLDHFGFPDAVSPFFGGMIGFFGIDKIREMSNSLLNRKLKSDESKKDED